MFKKMNKTLVALILGVSTTAFTTEWASFADYEKSINEQGKPKVMIVGCGHSNHASLEGDHLHNSAWTVDIKNPTDKELPNPSKPRSEQDPNKMNEFGDHNPFWKFTKANQMLDISVSTTCNSNKNMIGKFDNVVLERPWDITLNQPWTIYNATQFLKVGGWLVIDVHSTYRYYAYNSSEKSLLSTIQLDTGKTAFPIHQTVFENKRSCTMEELLRYKGIDPADFDEKEMIEGLQLLNINNKPTVIVKNSETEGLQQYLYNLGFTNVIGLNDIISSFSGRKGTMLIAQKTEATQKATREWNNQLKKFKAQ